MTSPVAPPRLGQLLLSRGLVERADLERALQLQRVLGGRLGANLLDLALVAEEDLLSTLGRQRASATVSASELIDVPAAILQLVPEHLVRRHEAVPFAVRGNTIHLAVKDPIDVARETEIAEATARLTRSFLGLDLRVEQALDNYYRGSFEGTRRYAQLAQRLEKGAPPSDVRRPSASQLLAQQWEENDASALADTAGIPISWERADARRALGRSETLEPETGVVVEACDETTEIVLSTVDPVEGPSLAPRSKVSLIAAKKLLTDARNRHNVAHVVLDSCARAFKRRALLTLQDGRIGGWAADGRTVVPHRFDTLAIEIGRAPSFLAIQRGADFWLGPLGRGTAVIPLIAALGGDPPSTCLILPIHLGGRLIGFLYLDNLEEGVAGAPIPDLEALLRLASQALETIIVRRKARLKR